MGSFSKNIALLALGFWLGCCVLAAVTAAHLFNQGLDGPLGGLNRDLAGAIAGTVFRDVYQITYVCIGLSILFLIMTCLGEARGARGPKVALFLCIVVLGLNAMSHLWILDKIQKIKLNMINSEGNAAHALKQDFDFWHKMSTRVYQGAVLCGFAGALFLLPGTPKGKSGGKSKSGKK